MAITSGSTSYFLIAKQTARGVRAPWNTFSNKIYQFNGGGIGLTGDFTNTPTNKGNFGPTATKLGQVGGEGSVQIPQDTIGMGLWIEALMSTSIAPSDSVRILATPVEMRAAATFVSGTPITTFITDTQPKDHLPGVTDSAPGVNAAPINLSFASTVRADTGATIVIEGFDQGEQRPLEETIPVTDAAAITDKTTENAFAEVTSITLNDFTTVGNVTVNYTSNLYKHTFNVGNALTNGLTVEMVKGTEPNTYQDVHVSEATWTMGDVNEFDMTLIGGRAYLGMNAENNGPAPSSDTGKARPDSESAAGWGTVFRLNDQRIDIGEASVTVNHSLGATENPTGRHVYRRPPVQTANREVTLSTRVDYPVDDIDGNRIDVAALAWGQDVSASIEAAAMDFGAEPNLVTIDLPNGKLSSFPDPADISQGQINQPLEVAGYAKGATTDFRITLINKETHAQLIS